MGTFEAGTLSPTGENVYDKNGKFSRHVTDYFMHELYRKSEELFLNFLK